VNYNTFASVRETKRSSLPSLLPTLFSLKVYYKCFECYQYKRVSLLFK